MHIEKIKFTDYNGTEQEREYYFNLNKAEILEMEMSENGGLDKLIERIVSTQDTKELISLFKGFVIKAYGEKSIDGLVFDKSQAVKDRFVQSEAYSELFMRLATDAEYAANFVNAVVPQEAIEEAKKAALESSGTPELKAVPEFKQGQ